MSFKNLINTIQLNTHLHYCVVSYNSTSHLTIHHRYLIRESRGGLKVFWINSSFEALSVVSIYFQIYKIDPKLCKYIMGHPFQDLVQIPNKYKFIVRPAGYSTGLIKK